MKKILLIIALFTKSTILMSNIIEANNQFAIDFYSQFKSDEDNFFFSPYSISTAMAMVYEGAKGKTAKEIQSVFYFQKEPELMRKEYLQLFSQLNKTKSKFKLQIANALWAEQEYKFLDAYFKRIEKYYRGKATNLDFKIDAESSRVTINDWVEGQTNNKIIDLVPPDGINYLTRLVITNAVYFKGKWVKQFNVDYTRDEEFRVNSKNIIKVPMMRRTDEDAIFRYARNGILQILEMPYSGEELSMLIILPQNENMKNLESILNAENLSAWKKVMKKQRVKIFIPRFKFENKLSMKNTLINMGMQLAFSKDADLSGMTGKKDLRIDQVIHQAFVEVNEEGTEAVAATSVTVSYKESFIPERPFIPIFRADHPFIFIIHQIDTGNILFMGRVSDPSK